MAYTASNWSDFSLGVAGAAATLVGLLFVAVSINLQRILEIDGLANRAGQTLLFLATPLFVAVFVLVPGQSSSALAGEILFVAFVTGAVHLRLALQSDRPAEAPSGLWVISQLLPAAAITGCLAVAGGSLLALGGGGLYWLVPGTVIAILFGIINAWVLLIEILR